MKKVILSLIISAVTVLTFASIIGYLIYQGIYLEIHKRSTSFPSWIAFAPAGLLGIILAPYIVCLVNHAKVFRLIKFNNNVVTRNIVNPALVGYFLVCISVMIVNVYLLFDAIFTKQFIPMNFDDPNALAWAFLLLGISHLLYVVPIVMFIVLAHEKKKA